ncbi:hypothetical protein L1787_05395 [Acuticoccus sp. M5D2P5]|uniref:Zn-ribbon domain-containing OB-fold protein n=1 Tax=Acuticoccus kalidii TaxID=2910977 RepID=UPI001F184E4D|nr:hypothetical protein [Acuticoccus kalidii]MCF3932850.1 hypothetical protein [Acuticoccus kalidii]
MTVQEARREGLGTLDLVAARGGGLQLPTCDHCGEIAWPPRLVCGRCHSLDTPRWCEVGPGGRIEAMTLVHAALGRAHVDRPPVPVAIVHLDFGAEIIALTHANVTYGDRVDVFAELDRTGRAVLVAVPRGMGHPSVAEVRESLGLSMSVREIALFGGGSRLADAIERIGPRVSISGRGGEAPDGVVVMLPTLDPIDAGARDMRFGDLLLATERMADHLRTAATLLMERVAQEPVTLVAVLPDRALCPAPNDSGGAAAAAAAFSLVSATRQRWRPEGLRVVTALVDDTVDTVTLAGALLDVFEATSDYVAIGPRAAATFESWRNDPMRLERESMGYL